MERPKLLIQGLLTTNMGVAFIVICALSQVTVAADKSKAPLYDVTSFAVLKARQARNLSKELNLSYTHEIEAFFDAAVAGDAYYVTNAFGVTRDPITGKDVLHKVKNALWPTLHETLGAYEQWNEWKNNQDLLRAYYEPILDSMPDQSIYLGGTDAGRFIVTTVAEIRNKPRIYCITQNAVADTTYTAYLRAVHGHEIWIPSDEDSASAFKRYVSEVDAGKRKANADITVKDGKVAAVSGARGVIEIAGLIVQMIFERNKKEHAFFVEESYVIDWMYPYLTPHGLIMKLDADRLDTLPPATVKADQEHWLRMEKKLNDIAAFSETDAARRAFSKCRCAIAGLYAFHKMHAEAESAFRQAIRLCPTSPEANYRLADLFKEMGDYVQSGNIVAAYLKTNSSPEEVKRGTTYLRELRKLRGGEQNVGQSNSITAPNVPSEAP